MNIHSYLSSLRDLPCGLHLHFISFSISGFLQSPFPSQHGLDGLFNGPAIDLLILKRDDTRVGLTFILPSEPKMQTQKDGKTSIKEKEIQTFSEKVLYGRSMGWVLPFSSKTSPYVQLFWILKKKRMC